MKIFGTILYVCVCSVIVLFLSEAKAQTKDEPVSLPLIGDTAPAFKANSTKGDIKFPDDYWQKWVIFFSHPGDFTPVCTSEIMAFANMEDKFKELNCELLGLSVDGINSHISWIKDIKDIKYKNMENVNITFPIISDFNFEIAKKYGMIQKNSSSTRTVRAVFIIDPTHIIRAVMYYPETVGRNVNEILRTLIALQVHDSYQVSTPADWQPGDDVVIPPKNNHDAAMKFYNEQNGDYYCPSWFFCLKKLPLENALKP
jgi:peroxiredoxin (alkyl hydroperoxide reductase subunit C)